MTDDRFHPKEMVLGVSAGGVHRAYLGSVLTAMGGRIVDVLGDHGDSVALLKLRQQLMGPVRLGGGELAASVIVEPQHQLLIARKRLGRSHIVDAVLLPQPTVVPEGGETAFGAYARACQHYDMILHQSKILPGFMIPLGSNTCLIPLR